MGRTARSLPAQGVPKIGHINVQQILLLIPAVLVGFTVHEFSHAYVAVRLGDRTPIDQGRYTLNPISHISLIGFILILFVGIGWAKPVQFNPNNFKKPRRGQILVALAGPIANLILAILFVLVLKILILINPALFQMQPYGPVVYRLLLAFVWINLLLFVFNLLPVPPLDGSHLVLGAIPDRYAGFKMGFMRYGAMALLILVLISYVTPYNLLPIGYLTARAFQLLTNLLL